ncbi:efflux transporter periplasmic adaptor subunit [Sphingobacteriaceae bacterium]|nr:efflux transporter periplasmic adaptor subunit [Sphingobacteriaceae bacterium]
MIKNKIIVGLFALVSLQSCSSSEKKEEKKELATHPETFLLQKNKFSTRLVLPGELIAYQQVDLYAKVTSFVKELHVDIGSEVSAGELLMTLEAPELLSQLAAAESRLKSLEANYTASSANYNRLVEAGKIPGTVSQNDLDQANAKKNADFSNLEGAKASYKEVGVIKSYLEIRAPFNGIITSRNVNPGAYVGPSGKGSEFPLLTLQEQKHLRLAVSIPEAYTGLLNQNDAVTFKVKSMPSETFTATIKRMAGALDLRLRSERIEMDIENEAKKLLPGTVAEVFIPLASKDSSFVVPKTALVNSNEGTYVIAVVDNKAKQIPVKKGRDVEDKTEVFGDLKINEELLNKANEEIKDGTPIR